MPPFGTAVKTKGGHHRGACLAAAPLLSYGSPVFRALAVFASALLSDAVWANSANCAALSIPFLVMESYAASL